MLIASSADTTLVGYAGVLAGLMVAFVSTIVTFCKSAHQLQVEMLMAGLFPCLTCGISLVFLRRTVTTVIGAILQAMHAWLVIRERFIDNADDSDGMSSAVSIVLTLVLFPLIIMALLQPWHE